jgi:DNA primase
VAISKELIDRIRHAADLVQVIGQVVSLKQTGNHWSGLCPFHKEKSPSFKVFPETQHFHCFGCGEGGSVFDFLMKSDGLTFPEAAEKLAGELGIEIPRSAAREAVSADDEVFETLELAARFYVAELAKPEASAAREYLRSRDLTEATISSYRIGFAPPGWDSLLGALGRMRNRDELARAGLLVRAKDGNRYYDRFRNRILFPIVSPSGRVIGFGGRAMGDDTPKYLNTPETAVYRKSRVLYGVREARTAIRQGKRVLVVEGYMDVLALHQAGFLAAVAACGTSLTAEHATLLARMAPEIVCVFDGDEAGVRAALRAFETLLPTGAIVQAVMMPEGKDPDDLVREGGGPVFEALLADRQDVVSFFYERTKGEPRPAALQRLSRLLALVPDVIVRQELVGRASDWFKFDEATFAGTVSRHRQRPQASRTTRAVPAPRETRSGTNVERPKGIEADLLRVALWDPSFAKVVEELMTRTEIRAFIRSRVRPATLTLLAELAEGRVDRSTLHDRTEDAGLRWLGSLLEAEEPPSAEVLEHLERDLARRLPLLALEGERDRLRRALTEASRRGDPESEAKLLARLRDVGRQLNALAQSEPSSSSA